MKSQLSRFGLIGIVNTLFDFILFALLTNLVGLHFFAANVLSTGAALSLSFFLNGRVTFQSRLNGRSAALFLVVTLAGLWALQPIVILVVEPLIRPIVSGLTVHDISILLAKLIATGFSLTWNFVLYKYIVFPQATTSDKR